MDERDLQNLLDEHFSEPLNAGHAEKLASARLQSPRFRREVEAFEEIDALLQRLERRPAPASLRHRVMASIRAGALAQARPRRRSSFESIRFFFASWQFQALVTACFLGGAVYLVLPALNLNSDDQGLVRLKDENLRPTPAPSATPSPAVLAPTNIPTFSPTPRVVVKDAPTVALGETRGGGLEELLGTAIPDVVVEGVSGQENAPDAGAVSAGLGGMDLSPEAEGVANGELRSLGPGPVKVAEDVGSGLMSTPVPTVQPADSVASALSVGALEKSRASEPEKVEGPELEVAFPPDPGVEKGASWSAGSRAVVDIPAVGVPQRALGEKDIGGGDVLTTAEASRGAGSVDFAADTANISVDMGKGNLQDSLAPPALKKTRLAETGKPEDLLAVQAKSGGSLVAKRPLLDGSSAESKAPTEAGREEKSMALMFLDEIRNDGNSALPGVSRGGLGVQKEDNREAFSGVGGAIASVADTSVITPDSTHGISERRDAFYGTRAMGESLEGLPRIKSDGANPDKKIALDYKNSDADQSYEYYSQGYLVGPPLRAGEDAARIADSRKTIASAGQTEEATNPERFGLDSLVEGFVDGKDRASLYRRDVLALPRISGNRVNEQNEVKADENLNRNERARNSATARDAVAEALLPPARYSRTPARDTGKSFQFSASDKSKVNPIRTGSRPTVPVAPASAAAPLIVDVYLGKSAVSPSPTTGRGVSRNSDTRPSPSKAGGVSSLSISQLESLFRSAGASVQRQGSTLVCSKPGGSKSWVLAKLATRGIYSSRSSGSAGFYSVRAGVTTSSDSQSTFRFEIRVK